MNSIMKWSIPAKTFFLGEYAAIAEASAILLTTNPCFEISLIDERRLEGIHPQSPAGIYWSKLSFGKGLAAFDPYHGKGGMGASSAQFLAAYLASSCLQNKAPDTDEMLKLYYQSAWQGRGLRPSGYDLLAQSQASLVFINRQQRLLRTCRWPFQDISFILIHTGQKLATHEYLFSAILPGDIHVLNDIVEKAVHALESTDSDTLIGTVSAYYRHLLGLNLVARHTQAAIETLTRDKDILAAKGCGAMGADVILLLVKKEQCLDLAQKLKHLPHTVLATDADLYEKKPLIKNNPHKTLEISS